MADFASDKNIKYPICRSMTEEERVNNITDFFDSYAPMGFPGFIQINSAYIKTKGPKKGRSGYVQNNVSSAQVHGSEPFMYIKNAPVDWSKESCVAGSLPFILSRSARNEYVTVNYKKLNEYGRKIKDMGWCGGILIDLDKHDEGMDIEPFVSFTLEKIMKGIEKGKLPIPTYIMHTGRGCQFQYRFSEYPSIEEKDVVKKIWEIIKDRWIDYIGPNLVEMDGSVGDASRICRIAGTYNVKGDAFTYLVSSSGRLYTLQEICDAFDINLEVIRAEDKEEKSKDSNKAVPKNKKNNSKNKSTKPHKIDRTPIPAYEDGSISIRCFGKDRFTKIDLLKTLDKLFEVRDDWTHHRDLYAHIYYNLLLSVYGKPYADKAIWDVYGELCDKSDDLDHFTEDEIEHIRETFYTGLGGILIYNYLKFETISDKLDISYDEIEAVGKTGYYERKNKKDAALKNNMLRNKKRNLCIKYRLEGYTQEDVVELVNRDLGLNTGDKGACNIFYVRRYAANINHKTDKVSLKSKMAYERVSKIVFKEEQKVSKISTFSMDDDCNDDILNEDNISPTINNTISSDTQINDNNHFTVEDAFNIFKSGNNLTILGAGGTGKSSFIERAKKYCDETDKSYSTIAFMGIASKSVDGITIHKALNLNNNNIDTVFSPEDNPNVANICNIWNTDVLFVDEIGCIRSDLGLFLIKSIKAAEESAGHSIQVVWLGDFLQISPVCSKEDCIALKEYGYSSPWLFSLPEWREVSGTKIVLSYNYRTTDIEYLGYLEKIRTNDCNDSDIAWINSNLNRRVDINAVYIAGTCDAVRSINQKMVNALFRNAEKKEYITSLDGTEKWSFAVGMKVMITRNSNYYQNGCRGTVIRMNEKSVTVKLNKSGIVVRVEIKDGYLPLTPCYAMTAHKAQGQTIEEGVNVVTEHNGKRQFFATGQLYTVLSRVHDRNSIHLLGDIKSEDIIIDKKAYQFQYGIPA